jgi:hypothetical protein
VGRKISKGAIAFARSGKYLDLGVQVLSAIGAAARQYAVEQLTGYGYKFLGGPTGDGFVAYRPPKFRGFDRFTSVSYLELTTGRSEISVYLDTAGWIVLPDDVRVAILMHELVHVRQVAGMGRCLFAMRRAFAGWRWALEVQAFREVMRVNKAFGWSTRRLVALARKRAETIRDDYALHALDPYDVRVETERALFLEAVWSTSGRCS